METMTRLVEERLCRTKVTPSIAEFIRLVELREELEEDEEKAITVQWVDECQQTPDCAE